MNRSLATWSAAAILILGIAAIGVANNGTTPAGTPDVCAGLDSGKIDTTGDPATVTLTAPPPALITEYCVKAGSAQSGGGPVYVTVDPPQASITIGHPTGKAVSHYSFSFEGPPETTVPETTTPTTVPETTSTPPDTTVPEQTTTTAVTTTTEPTQTTTTTSEPDATTTTTTTEPESTTTTSVQTTTTTTEPPPDVTTTTRPRTTLPVTR